MTQQIINVGSTINDGTGDPARTAFTKSNDNFTELYARGNLTPPQGRLTLQTATPVMTTTQSAKTTIYYTPYVGNRVPIYDGTNMIMTAFAELSNVTTASSVGNAGPAAVAASSVYDLFVWSNSGAVTLTRGPAWTNDTTRSAGTALVMVAGLLLNSLSITNGPAASRGIYVGTTRSNASSQLDFIVASSAANGGQGFIGVWNAYNRVDVRMQMNDSTATWTYGSTTIRAANASNTARISFVSGLQDDGWRAAYFMDAVNSSTGFAYAGVGYDSITAISGYTGRGGATGSARGSQSASYTNSSLGFHYVSALEYSSAGTITVSGNQPAGDFSWLEFEWRC